MYPSRPFVCRFLSLHPTSPGIWKLMTKQTHGICSSMKMYAEYLTKNDKNVLNLSTTTIPCGCEDICIKPQYSYAATSCYKMFLALLLLHFHGFLNFPEFAHIVMHLKDFSQRQHSQSLHARPSHPELSARPCYKQAPDQRDHHGSCSHIYFSIFLLFLSSQTESKLMANLNSTSQEFVLKTRLAYIFAFALRLCLFQLQSLCLKKRWRLVKQGCHLAIGKLWSLVPVPSSFV